MKKFLILAVTAMAVASQGAAIQWQVSSTTADGFAAGQTALIFVGLASETFSYGGADNLSLADYVNALLADGTDKATAAAFDTETTSSVRGKISTPAQTKNVDYEAGTDIVGMIVILDGNGKYNAFSVHNTIGAGNTPLNTAMPSATSTGFIDLPTAGGDTPAVPEPATGALALAGVALLFKRRRA